MSPLPYDLWPKSFDHFGKTGYLHHSNILGVTNRLGYNRNGGFQPRTDNLFLRIPLYSDLIDSEFSLYEYDDIGDGDYYKWALSNRSDIAYKANSVWSKPEEYFEPPTNFESQRAISQIFTTRRANGKRHYKRHFDVYAYGDWAYRRSLLNNAYSFKSKAGSNPFFSKQSYYHFIRNRASDLHFANLYAKNLRDHTLYKKPNSSYAFSNVYAHPMLRHLAKDGLSVLGHSENPRSLNPFSKTRPYEDTSSPEYKPRYLNTDEATGFNLAGDIGDSVIENNGTTTYEYPYLVAVQTYYALFGEKLHQPIPKEQDLDQNEYLTKEERSQYLATARAVRAMSEHYKLLHLTTQFSNYFYYKPLVTGSQYPYYMSNLYLDYLNSLMPSIQERGAGQVIVDPYSRKLIRRPAIGVSVDRVPNAFTKPLVPSVRSGLGQAWFHNTAPSHLSFDPVQLYNLAPQTTFFALPAGSHQPGLRFTTFFDNTDVYTKKPSEFREFNLSANLRSRYLRFVAEYESQLSDQLNDRPTRYDFRRNPYPLDAHLRMYEQTIQQWKLLLTFGGVIDFYDRNPIFFDPTDQPTYTKHRRAHRLGLELFSPLLGGDLLDSTIFRERFTRSQVMPGLHYTRRFSTFADFFTAAAEYNYVKSLDKIYFSEYLKINRLLPSDILPTWLADVDTESLESDQQVENIGLRGLTLNRRQILEQKAYQHTDYKNRWQLPKFKTELSRAVEETTAQEAFKKSLKPKDKAVTPKKKRCIRFPLPATRRNFRPPSCILSGC